MTTKTQENKEEVKAPDTEAPGAEAPAKPKYDKAELLAIFDEMIFSGEYTEEVSLRGGKLKVVFKTRSAEDTTTITRELDGKNFALISTLQEQRALKNLAYSLVMYAGKDIKDMSVEDKAKFIGRLPEVIVGILSEALGKFDSKTYAACQEGEANF
jgi:hypothetical protein